MPPNQPATPTRSFRCPDERWEAAARLAAERGETMTAWLNRLIEREIREHPMPEHTRQGIFGQAGRLAAARGDDLTVIVREALVRYLEENGPSE